MKNDDFSDYTHLADDYDEKRYIEDGQIYLDSLRYQAIRSLLKPNKEMTIIDVGTGTGSGIIYFAKFVKKIVGLDGTEAMLAKAFEKMKNQSISNAELIHANALSIPYEDESFDNVISLNFIHLFAPSSINKQMEFIAEMERICKKGGNVIVEFDNAIYQKELGNNYSELFKMSRKMVVKDIVGTYMPKALFLFRHSNKIADIYSTLAKLPFIKRFAYKWIVRYQRVF